MNQNKLIDSKGSIDPHEWFTFPEGKNKDKRLRIVGTKSNGKYLMDCIDTIKNLDTGKKTEVARKTLRDLNPIYYTDEH